MKFNVWFKPLGTITVESTYANEKEKIYTTWWKRPIFNELKLGLRRTISFRY